MTTLCERLRDGRGDMRGFQRAAADRIEALEAALREIKELPSRTAVSDSGLFMRAVMIASRALKGATQAPTEAREAAVGRVEG